MFCSGNVATPQLWHFWEGGTFKTQHACIRGRGFPCFNFLLLFSYSCSFSHLKPLARSHYFSGIGRGLFAPHVPQDGSSSSQRLAA